MSMDFNPKAFAARAICERVKSSSLREGVRIIAVSAQSVNGELFDIQKQISLNYSQSSAAN